MKLRPSVIACILTMPWAAYAAATNDAKATSEAESARSQVQTRHAGKQALTKALQDYLAAEPARNKALLDATERLYACAFAPPGEAGSVPDTNAVGLVTWQKDLDTLATLDLPPETKVRLRAMDTSLKEAARLLTAVPPPPPQNADPATRMAARQTAIAAQNAIRQLLERSGVLDALLQRAAALAASEAGQLADRLLLLPAPAKGEKP